MQVVYSLFLGLSPNEPAALGADARLDKLAVGKSGPEVREEVGPLLDVLLAQEGGDGPGCLLGMIERNATGGSVSVMFLWDG